MDPHPHHSKFWLTIRQCSNPTGGAAAFTLDWGGPSTGPGTQQTLLKMWRIDKQMNRCSLQVTLIDFTEPKFKKSRGMHL